MLMVGIAIGAALSPLASAPARGEAQAQSLSPAPAAVYELRTYTTNEGKLPALQARFRDHTMKIFERHGIRSVGYWIPQDAPRSANTLIYIVAHASREAAARNWDAFRQDPEWQQVAAASEANGKLLANVDSMFMDTTDFSPLK
jgi:NIPSNAP